MHHGGQDADPGDWPIPARTPVDSVIEAFSRSLLDHITIVLAIPFG
jgi:hypothetical protein